MQSKKSVVRWTDSEKVLVTAEVARQLYARGVRILLDRKFKADFINDCVKTVFGNSNRFRVLKNASDWAFIDTHLAEEFELVRSEMNQVAVIQVKIDEDDALIERLLPKMRERLIDELLKDYVFVPIKVARKSEVVIELSAPAPVVDVRPKVCIYGLLGDQFNRVAEAFPSLKLIFLSSERKWSKSEIPNADYYIGVTSFMNHSTFNHLKKMKNFSYANGGVESVKIKLFKIDCENA